MLSHTSSKHQWILLILKLCASSTMCPKYTVSISHTMAVLQHTKFCLLHKCFHKTKTSKRIKADFIHFFSAWKQLMPIYFLNFFLVFCLFLSFSFFFFLLILYNFLSLIVKLLLQCSKLLPYLGVLHFPNNYCIISY